MLHPGLEPLAGYRQFILYKLEPRSNQKIDKVPYSVHTIEPHDAHDAAHWTDYETAAALALALGEGYGAGFVLTESDPFFCLDLDHCLLPNGQWSDVAASIADSLPGVAIEVSQSGSALHFWGVTPPLTHRTRPDPDSKCPWGAAELYTKRRFIALTGNVLAGHAGTQVDLQPFVDAWFKPQSPSTVDANEWNLEPVPSWRGPANDEELIRRALTSHSANAVWGAGVSFADLWNGNGEALAKRWPSEVGKATAWNESQADAALAAHLAFWTGCHHQRIAELMHRSALIRPKWEREDYLTRTIRLACSAGRDVLQDAPVVVPSTEPKFLPEPPTPLSPPAVLPLHSEAIAGVPAPILQEEGGTPLSSLKQGRTILGAAEQQALFKGCVYVRRPNRIFVPDVAYTLDQAQFNATFGGRQFITADGKMVKSPWEAFTQNSVVEFPRVDDEDFNPSRDCGRVYRNDHGEWVINTYFPANAPSAQGDVGLWWLHMQNLFPNEEDRHAFMSWVCALVRYPGRKFAWSPLLISGEGTGKTLTYDAIRAAMGHRYTRSVRGASLAGRFNDWIGRTLLCVVEDFRLPKASERDDLLEKLKEMVGGGERIESEGKGQHATNVRNQCNFIFSANKLDVLRLDENSRRWAPFAINLWNEGQLLSVGMDSNYFLRLRNWLQAPQTAAALRHLFLTWPIPDHLNPATHCTRAPRTSTAATMYQANRDPAVETIEEAVLAGLYGLREGWATPDTVRIILEKERMTLSQSSACRLLERMGYVPHPALKDGVTTHPVAPYNKKLKLYIHNSARHCHSNMSPQEVVKLYQAHQETAFEFIPVFGTQSVAGMIQ